MQHIYKKDTTLISAMVSFKGVDLFLQMIWVLNK